jgi:hypothetical protein
VKKTKQPDQNERLKGSTKVSSTEEHAGDSGDSCMLTLNRLRTHALCCASCRVYVVKPWEKGNAHGLEFDLMV